MSLALAYGGHLYAPTPAPPEQTGYLSEHEVRNLIGAQMQQATEHFRAPQHQNYIRGLFGQPGNPANQAELIANGYPTLTRAKQQGETLGAVTRALAANRGDLYRAQQWAAQIYPHDEAVNRALAASTQTAGGVFVQQEVFAEVTELLRSATVVRSFNPLTIDMATGVTSIPKITDGSVATYVGENEDDTANDMAFGDVLLVWKKLRSTAVISNDLLRFNSPGADVIVRNDMVQSLAVGQDRAFLRGNGTQFSPKGLRHWALPSNILAAVALPATVDGIIQTITDDLNRIWNALLNNNIPMINPGFIMAPRVATFLRTFRSSLGALVWGDEMNTRGTLLGIPFRVTTSVPINIGTGNTGSELTLVDFNDAVIGESLNLIIDVSTEASYIQDGELRSAFSRDQTVVRAIQEHDFAMRRDESVAILDDVQWGA